MNVESILRALAAGAPIAADGLLQTCRAAAFGADLYGAEAIVEAFRRQPIDGEAVFVSSPGHAALLWADRVLIADIAGEHVARLWRLGPGSPVEREPAVSVPFDADLSQMPASVAFAASDHPALAPRDVDAVLASGTALAAEWRDADNQPAARIRPFCIRAFSADETVVALFAVHVVDGTGARHAGFVHAAAVVGAEAITVIRDGAGEMARRLAPWQPRIG